MRIRIALVLAALGAAAAGVGCPEPAEKPPAEQREPREPKGEPSREPKPAPEEERLDPPADPSPIVRPRNVREDTQVRTLLRAGLVPRVIVRAGPERAKPFDFQGWESRPFILESTGDAIYDLPPDRDLGKTAERLQELVDRARAERAAEDVEIDGIVRAAGGLVPNDAAFPQQWALDNKSAATRDINAPEAWQALAGVPASKPVVVGVIDTGVRWDFPELAPNLWTNDGESGAKASNSKDDDGNGYIDDFRGLDALAVVGTTGTVFAGLPKDEDGHGTAVAAIIGAVGDNKHKVAGILWNVKMIPCRALSRVAAEAHRPRPPDTTCGPGGDECLGRTSDVAICLDYVARLAKERGVAVVATNNSWSEDTKSACVERAIAAHRDLGILFVAAAGRANAAGDANADVAERYPGGYWQANVVTVAAHNEREALVPDSAWGKRSVHLAAPGENIRTIQPSTDPAAVLPDAEALATFRATSAAAPHVTGVIALLRSFDPGLSWTGLRNRVLAGRKTGAAYTSKTVSKGRLLAFKGGSGQRAGAMTCKDKVLQRRLRPLTDCVTVPKSAAVGIAALHVRCENPAGDVTVEAASGAQQATPALVLADAGGANCAGGTGPACDQVANDGIYAGAWKAGTGGTTKLVLSYAGATWPGESLEVKIGTPSIATKSCPYLE